MKSWKKLFALLMALAMLFAFAACSESDEGEDNTPKANASIQKYVDENRSDILEGMESGFVSSSGMTCTSDIQVVGDGIVITFNINELEDLSADEKEHYQSLYDAQAALLNTLLPTMQTELPELEYFTINICEKDGTKIATVTIDGKNSGNLNPGVKPNPDPKPSTAPADKDNSAVLEQYLNTYAAEFLEGMEEGFASTSGLTCTSSAKVQGNGFVFQININELDDVDAATKQAMQDSYDAQLPTFEELLPSMQIDIPELEYFQLLICEGDGDVLASITVGDK